MRKLKLRTPRLRLVLPDPSEAAATLDYYVRNRAHLRATEPRLPEEYFTVNFRRARLEENIAAFAGGYGLRLFLELEENPGRFVGVVNFNNIIRGVFQACHLGYSIDADQEGKGLMREALAEGIRYVFEELRLHRVMANYLPENERSGGLLKRLGFEIEGTAEGYLFINGEWRDHVLTSLVNPAWRAREEERLMFEP